MWKKESGKYCQTERQNNPVQHHKTSRLQKNQSVYKSTILIIETLKNDFTWSQYSIMIEVNNMKTCVNRKCHVFSGRSKPIFTYKNHECGKVP